MDKVLTSLEICEIIKACAASAVAEFKFGDLSITFGKQTNAVEPKDAPVPKQAISEEKHTQITEEQLAIEAAQTREEKIAYLLLEDPEEAERLLIQEGLNAERSEGTDREEPYSL